ncbi:MAG: lipoate protein ligase C-terminal domain-containing protein [Thermoplasmata archaeon]
MKFEYKEKGSKLIVLDINWKDNKIEKIKIYGDFFLHPEESIFLLEKNLTGKGTNEIENVLIEFFNHVEYAGIDPETLLDAITKSLVKQ